MLNNLTTMQCRTERVQLIKKQLAKTLAPLCILFLFLEYIEISYRIYLFYHEYQGNLWMNHGMEFAFFYFASICLTLMSLVLTYCAQKLAGRVGGLLCVLFALAGILLVMLLHNYGVFCTHEEWLLVYGLG